MSASTFEQTGAGQLWQWFGLDRASFVVLPRVLLHAMPDPWQGRLAELLEEWDAAWTWPEGWGTTVRLTVDGRLEAMPRWLLNYRHPDRDQIQALRAGGEA